MDELGRVIGERGLSLSINPEKGRCLYAARDFHPGEVILSQAPYVCVPTNSSVQSRCDGCFTTTNVKKCSGCQFVWYCGSSCQKSEWKLHRLECQALTRLEKDKRKFVTPTIRLMVKLYLKRRLQDEKVIPRTATDNYSLVEAFVSHMSEIDEKQLLLYAQMANLVNVILQLPNINLKEVAENFSKFACNAHTICDSELRPQGTGLYSMVSIINHSCLPSAVLMFEGNVAVIRAMQHIPKDSEVTISYIETAGSTMTRQKTLREQYFFSCTCPRCIKFGQPDDIEESAILEGYRCADDRCNGFLLRDSNNNEFVCQRCGLQRTKDVIKGLAGAIKRLTEQDPPTSSSPEKRHDAIMFYKILEDLQVKLCHPFSINLARIRETLLKMLMEAEEWREALNYCRLTLVVYERVYPAVHPLLGLQFYTCGKLEWFLGETEDAVSSLIRAADILRITHGTSSAFMKELLAKLDEARAEASYKRSSREADDDC